METLTFTTPIDTHRPQQTITVDMCGSEFTVYRPKDSVRMLAATATAQNVSTADQAAGILSFMGSVLEPNDFHTWKQRVKDQQDRLNRAETAALIEGLITRWDEFDADDPDESTLVIDYSSPERVDVQATRVVSQDRADGLDDDEIGLYLPADLDLDVVFTQPKEMVAWIVHAGLANPDDIGQQVWSLGYFCEACLSVDDDAYLSSRLRSKDPDDLLDLGPLADIVNALLTSWKAQADHNRQERRAQAKKPKQRPGNPGGGKARAQRQARAQSGGAAKTTGGK